MTDTRSDFIAGLRALADLLEANDDLPLPYHGTGSQLLWIASINDDHKALAQRFARLIPGPVTKKARGTDFDLIGKIGGLSVQMIVDRDAVCTRRVVGKETVTLPAVDAQPERTVEREVVEWDCEPVLAEQVPA